MPLETPRRLRRHPPFQGGLGAGSKTNAAPSGAAGQYALLIQYIKKNTIRYPRTVQNTLIINLSLSNSSENASLSGIPGGVTGRFMNTAIEPNAASNIPSMAKNRNMTALPFDSISVSVYHSMLLSQEVIPCRWKPPVAYGDTPLFKGGLGREAKQTPPLPGRRVKSDT